MAPMQTARPTSKVPLRTIRKAQNLTLQRAAELAQIDIGHLSRVERGQASLSVDALARLAAVLDLKDLARLLAPYRKKTG
jgi:transcriptional regulator with XRE-family HTH domain